MHDFSTVGELLLVAGEIAEERGWSTDAASEDGDHNMRVAAGIGIAALDYIADNTEGFSATELAFVHSAFWAKFAGMLRADTTDPAQVDVQGSPVTSTLIGSELGRRCVAGVAFINSYVDEYYGV